MALSKEFKQRISETIDSEILNEEIQAMLNIINSEYSNYSLRLELIEKITYIQDRLYELINQK